MGLCVLRFFFYTPLAILETAATTGSVSSSLDFCTELSGPDDRIYVFLHFADLQQLVKNETREMDAFMNALNGQRWIRGTFSPTYLVTNHIFTSQPGTEVRRDFSIRATNRSTLPPSLNGVEVYNLKQMNAVPTDGEHGD